MDDRLLPCCCSPWTALSTVEERWVTGKLAFPSTPLRCVAKLFQWIRWLVIETSGLAIELAIWLFAFTLIWDLNAQLQRRVKLLMIFAARLMYVCRTSLTES
jgi:hypothetical protein